MKEKSNNLKKAENQNLSRALYSSPIGAIEILANDRGIRSLKFLEDDKSRNSSETNSRPSFLGISPEAAESFTSSNAFAHLKRALSELDGYFNGTLSDFTVELDLSGGAEFHLKVWEKLREIPSGETMTYGQIAKSLDNPGAARAVGQANNRNQIAIILPCHRVLGADGSLTGYAYGEWRKEYLLNHERTVTEASKTPSSRADAG